MKQSKLLKNALHGNKGAGMLRAVAVRPWMHPSLHIITIIAALPVTGLQVARVMAGLDILSHHYTSSGVYALSYSRPFLPLYSCTADMSIYGTRTPQGRKTIFSGSGQNGIINYKKIAHVGAGGM